MGLTAVLCQLVRVIVFRFSLSKNGIKVKTNVFVINRRLQMLSNCEYIIFFLWQYSGYTFYFLRNFDYVTCPNFFSNFYDLDLRFFKGIDNLFYLCIYKVNKQYFPLLCIMQILTYEILLKCIVCPAIFFSGNSEHLLRYYCYPGLH